MEAATTSARTTAPPKKKGPTERARAERKLAWTLCAPAVIAMLLVTGYPIAYAFYLSLQKFDLRFPDDKEFIGLSNYADVLTSSTWWSGVLNTVIITVISVSIELVLGMAIALVMHRAIFGRGPVRAAILIPYGIVTVVAAFAWLFAFQPTTGFVQDLPLISDTAQPLNTREGSFVVIILAEVWKTTPFMALLLLAGLSLVPDELHEAAKVDGASAVQRFFRITLPLMRPAILVALLFRTLDAFRIFDNIFIIQPGGALGTESVSILGYNVLINRVNLGLGSAVSILIFMCVIPVAWITSLSFKTPEEVGDRKFFSGFSFENYDVVFSDDTFIAALINSIGIAGIATLISIVLAAMAAYATSRLDFTGKALILSGALAVAMFPPISIVGSLFDMWRGLGT